MPLFEKDALYPAIVHPPDSEAPFEIKPENVAHLTRRLSEMVAAGLNIPVAWEHQNKAKPLTRDEWSQQLAELTKLTLGSAVDAKVADGKLVTILDVPNESDGERLAAVKFVSPEITWNYKDGTGRVWPGPSITHFAVTAKPVQPGQQPFKRLSMTDDYQPPLRLSLTDFRLSEAGNAETPPADPPADATAPEKIKKVVEVAGRMGLMLPDDTNADNVLDRLYVAMLTFEKATNPAGQATNEGETAVNDQNNAVALSLESLTTRVLNTEKKDLSRRIAALFTSGRITKPIREKLDQELGAATLRLSQAGALEPVPVIFKIEAYEAQDEGTAWPAGRRLSQNGEQPREIPPPSYGPPQNPAEVKTAVDGFFAALGR